MTPPSSPAAVLDTDTLTMLVAEIDREGVEEMIHMFIADMPGQVEECARRLAADDLPALEREAHSVKGAASSLGAVGLAAAARELELAAERGDCTECPGFVEAMRRSIADTVRALQAWLADA